MFSNTVDLSRCFVPWWRFPIFCCSKVRGLWFTISSASCRVFFYRSGNWPYKMTWEPQKTLVTWVYSRKTKRDEPENEVFPSGISSFRGPPNFRFYDSFPGCISFNFKIKPVQHDILQWVFLQVITPKKMFWNWGLCLLFCWFVCKVKCKPSNYSKLLSCPFFWHTFVPRAQKILPLFLPYFFGGQLGQLVPHLGQLVPHGIRFQDNGGVNDRHWVFPRSLMEVMLGAWATRNPKKNRWAQENVTSRRLFNGCFWFP